MIIVIYTHKLMKMISKRKSVDQLKWVSCHVVKKNICLSCAQQYDFTVDNWSLRDTRSESLLDKVSLKTNTHWERKWCKAGRKEAIDCLNHQSEARIERQRRMNVLLILAPHLLPSLPSVSDLHTDTHRIHTPASMVPVEKDLTRNEGLLSSLHACPTPYSITVLYCCQTLSPLLFPTSCVSRPTHTVCRSKLSQNERLSFSHTLRAKRTTDSLPSLRSLLLSFLFYGCSLSLYHHEHLVSTCRSISEEKDAPLSFCFLWFRFSRDEHRIFTGSCSPALFTGSWGGSHGPDRNHYESHAN